MKSLFSLKHYNSGSLLFFSSYYRTGIRTFSQYFGKRRNVQFKKKDILIKDHPTPPSYSPILYENDEVCVYQDHPVYETVELSDRDYRESRKNEDLKFKISGLESQVAIIDIYPGQKIKSETDKIIYFSEGIEMNTILGGFMSSFKRLFTGSTLFMTEYYFKYEKGFGRVAFAENFPSKIIPIRFTDYNGEIICQKGAFLCGTEDVQIDLEFSKTFKTGFFGGDYIFQKLKGTGTCLIHAGGSIIKRRLRVKEKIKVSIGLIVAYENSVKYEKKFVKGVKNMIGAGSLVFATLTGPGDVYLQTMHFEELVNEIVDNINTGSTLKHDRSEGRSREEENEKLMKMLEEEQLKEQKLRIAQIQIEKTQAEEAEAKDKKKKKTESDSDDDDDKSVMEAIAESEKDKQEKELEKERLRQQKENESINNAPSMKEKDRNLGL